MIITNKKQYAAAVQQTTELNRQFSKKIIEPVGHNTAPAITLACLSVNPEDILFVTPSDQMIGDHDIYQKKLENAIELAREGYLVTFDIQPTRPDTSFGYIELNEEKVIRFAEKPAFKKAVEFLEQGNFLWNSWMFCFKAGVFLEEIKKHHPAIYKASFKAFNQIADEYVPLDAMEEIPSESVDYAVFEKSDLIKVSPPHFFGLTLALLMPYWITKSNNPLTALKLSMVKTTTIPMY